jgi:fucose 4-O-acetylase-like acetyltransferase
MSYLRFGAMIGTSMAVMYGVMYVNTFELAHVRWSETRLFMTLLMGSTMAIIMLGFMLSMYKNRRFNIAIVAASVVLFGLGTWLVRSQTTVQETSYMSAMIPHHSIAILTSERAEIRDVRVRALADEIAATQREEIRLMEWLIDDIGRNGVAETSAAAAARPAPVSEAGR